MTKKITTMVGCLLLSLNMTSAMAITLTDGNSSATIDPTSQSGMNNWTVDGTNYLKQQWFWLRSDQVTLTSIDNLTLDQQNQPNSNELQLRYGTSTTLWIDISYELTGGPNGSAAATLNETIEITNNGTQNLPFSFFQYSDFDLDPQGQDSVEITNGDTATQQGGQASMTESVTTITPGTIRVEAALAPSTKDALTSDPNYQLTDLFASMAGPGDVTSAFQWDGILGAGSSFNITKTKTISGASTNPIPEPSTLLLFGTGLLIAGLARTKSRK